MSNWQKNHIPSIYCSVSASTAKFPCTIFRCLNSSFSWIAFCASAHFEFRYWEVWGLLRWIKVGRESTVKHVLLFFHHNRNRLFDDFDFWASFFCPFYAYVRNGMWTLNIWRLYATNHIIDFGPVWAVKMFSFSFYDYIILNTFCWF